jgi:hypothetical protein
MEQEIDANSATFFIGQRRINGADDFARKSPHAAI